MNKIKYIILSAAAVLVGLTSCDRKIEFANETFVSFYAASYSVKEDAGKVKIPVVLYNGGDKEVNITVKATPDADRPATAGKDYKIVSPESGILTFAPGEDTKEIEIEVIAHTGDVTGTLAFSLSLESAAEGVTVGNLNTIPFSIADNDRPFTWFGHWTGTAQDKYGKYPMNVEISDNGDGTVKVTNLEPWLATEGINSAKGYQIYTGTLNADKTTITVPKDQEIGITSSIVSQDGDDTPVLICGFPAPNPEELVLTDIIINKNEDGTIVIPNALGMYAGSSLYGLYPGGIILTYAD